ncbi:hypothetical protein ABZ345_33095 [Lentzea sp. NPDC005914]|uniref:hypothetical protein n=1 Tax=Lentzea sp. NPDC005914 TaxID=3154572 RepID=UPI003401DC36
MISFKELARRRYVRRGVIVFAVMTAALGSGVAYAAWTSSGNGSATTKAGTAQAPVVSGGAVTTGLLYPTGTAIGTAVVTVQNPNPYPVVVASVAPNGPVPAVGSCPASTVSFTAQAPGTAIAAGGTVTITMPNSVAMIANAANACQGADFAVPVTVTIASA